MVKEFLEASLVLTSVDPITEKKSSIRLNDLVEDAEDAVVNTVRQSLQGLIEEPITTVRAVVTYAYA